MIMKPPRCWRGRTDCEPLHAIEGFDRELTDAYMDDLESGKADPPSFVCAGCIEQSARGLPQDAYRVCWKNDEVDDTGDYDEQDLAHQAAVLIQALAIISARRNAGGFVTVPVANV